LCSRFWESPQGGSAPRPLRPSGPPGRCKEQSLADLLDPFSPGSGRCGPGAVRAESSRRPRRRASWVSRMPLAASPRLDSRSGPEVPGRRRALPELIGRPISSQGPSRRRSPSCCCSSCRPPLVVAEVAEAQVYPPPGWEPSLPDEPVFRSLNRTDLLGLTHARNCCSTSPVSQPYHMVVDGDYPCVHVE
jgi:hypothetical protein